MAKEIVTLQIGSLANFTGTHFWNSCDDLFNSDNSQILYRNGIESYAPRLVSIDLKGATNQVYPVEAQSETVPWTGKVVTVEKEKSENAFLSNLNSIEPQMGRFAADLEEKVLFTSDFSKLYYHPKSICPVTQSFNQNGFNNFNQGVEIWQNEEWRSCLLDDHIRFFMEECDSPQGFQTICDVDDGFCGVSSELLQRLYDDYPKKSFHTVSVGMDSIDSNSNALKHYNRALGVHHLSQVSSLYVPLTVPLVNSIQDGIWAKYLDISKTSRYHWSGYLSTIYQTMFFPLHVAVNGTFMSQMEMSSIIRGNGDAPIAALNAILPFPIWKVDSGDIYKTLRVLKPNEFHYESVNLTTMKPYDKASKSLGQIAVLRGATNLIKHVDLDSKLVHRYSSVDDIQNILDNYLNSFTCSSSKSIVIDDPFICDQSFPNLCRSLTLNGIVSSQESENDHANQLAVMTRLHTSPDLYYFVMEHTQLLKSRISSKSFENILEAEELRDWTEDLMDLAQQYI